MLKLGVLGASGRMGKLVSEQAAIQKHTLHALVDSKNFDTLIPKLLECDALIDFSLPDATTKWAQTVVALPKSVAPAALPGWIIGTTGFSTDQRNAVRAASERCAVLQASNYSLGAQALIELGRLSGLLLGQASGYRAEIREVHHTQKRDAPSGTALSLQAASSPEGPGNIPIQSIREGDVVGEHTLSWIGPDERLTLTHEALDRSVFARGAIHAALWIQSRRGAPKLYSARDWIQPVSSK